jgi:hypothetical protein
VADAASSNDSGETDFDGRELDAKRVARRWWFRRCSRFREWEYQLVSIALNAQRDLRVVCDHMAVRSA